MSNSATTDTMNKAVVEALRTTRKRVADCFTNSTFAAASSSAPPCPPGGTLKVTVYHQPPQLVAVSKTKPVHLLQACYDNEQRHFGENYVQEIIEKVPQMPADVKWHFIGPIQSNKVNKLINHTWPHLHVIETVGTLKLANKLEAAVGRVIADPSVAVLHGGESSTAVSNAEPPRTEPLGVLVQVNTSGESQKSGVAPGEETIALAKHVIEQVQWCGVRVVLVLMLVLMLLLVVMVVVLLHFCCGQLYLPNICSYSHLFLLLLIAVPTFKFSWFNDNWKVRW